MLIGPFELFGRTPQLIDFSLFLNGSHEDKMACAKAMTDGFKTAGFLYIKNHGISEETVKKIFSEVGILLLSFGILAICLNRHVSYIYKKKKQQHRL